MTFWDWADKHPVALVFCLLLIAFAIPTVSVSWKHEKKGPVK